jgi:hypothetical protein
MWNLLAVRDQEPLFGPVESDTTAFWLVDRIASDGEPLEMLRTARARARARVGTGRAGAAVNFNGGFGFHRLLTLLDGSHEALAGALRPGNARRTVPPIRSQRSSRRSSRSCARSSPTSGPRSCWPPIQPARRSALPSCTRRP